MPNSKDIKRIGRYAVHISDVQEKFLIKRLRTEWEAAEKALKRHELIRAAKLSGSRLIEVLFKLLIFGGALTIAAIAPNMFAVFGKTMEHKRVFEKSGLKNGLYEAKRQKYIIIKKKGRGEYMIEITKKGRDRLLKFAADNLKIKKMKKWDGKWWIVIFDIPRKHNNVRNVLREKLKNLGMRQLQESVFISSNPCREEVEFWACLYNANDFIHIIKAESISNFDQQF